MLMVRSCKVASMQGVHTCTDMTLGWSATFALPKPAQRLSCRASHMEAQPLPLSQTCATLEMGRRSPQTFATLEKGGAFHREAQPSPLSQTFAPPKPAHRRWSAGLGRSSACAAVGATRVGVLEGFAFASRGRILAKSQKCQKRDIVDSQSTHEGELSPLAGKTGPFLLHEG